MDEKMEYRLFVEELWERILDLRVGSGLTDAQVVMALEMVKRRVVKLMQEED